MTRSLDPLDLLVSRRRALGTLGIAAAGASAPGLWLSGCASARAHERTAAASGPALSTAQAQDLVQAAVAQARRAGASYADARLLTIRTQYVWSEDRRIDGVVDVESRGLGVRVVVDGAWGFAAGRSLVLGDVASTVTSAIGVARAAARLPGPARVRLADEDPHRGHYRTPRRLDPFEVPIADKAELLLGAAERMLAVQGVTKAYGQLRAEHRRTFFASSEGSVLDTDRVLSICGIEAMATAAGDARSRSYDPPALHAGYEHVLEARLQEHATRVGEEAVAKLRAPSVSSGDYDLILMPSHLRLTIHETVGHATELDRALGMEESLSGGTFATPDKVGTLRYGSPLVNLRALDRPPVFLASVGYDDDGVTCQDWDIVREGVLVGYSSNREVAPAIGRNRSTGTSRADSWSSIPIVRMGNCCLLAGRERLTLEELIADTRRGILIDGLGSWSIDNRRLNFQFGGDAFWEIRDGKRQGMLRDVTYSGITPEFWGSCDAICDQRAWQPYAVENCGKGDPVQTSRMTHGSAPTRFRQVHVRRAE